jgi:hypothetical protein
MADKPSIHSAGKLSFASTGRMHDRRANLLRARSKGYVGFWHRTDLSVQPDDFCFWWQNGHAAPASRGLSLTRNGPSAVWTSAAKAFTLERTENWDRQ